MKHLGTIFLTFTIVALVVLIEIQGTVIDKQRRLVADMTRNPACMVAR